MNASRLHTIAASAALFCIVAPFVTSCSSDDDEFYIPENVIMLNMMNESNGATELGESGVYINDSDNFTSSGANITDLGLRGGYNQAPSLSQLAREMAVTPGNYYQVFSASDIRNFASGRRALKVNARYYNMYVGEWINDDDHHHIGAKVSYLSLNPQESSLPGWDYVMGTLTHVENPGASWISPESLSFNFPSSAEINVDYNGLESYLKIEVDGSSVSAEITNNRPRQSGDAYLYVRNGDLFTRVIIEVRYTPSP